MMNASKAEGANGVRQLRARPATIVLDSQGLSLLVARDRALMARIKKSRDAGAQVMASVNSIVEIAGQGVDARALDWALSDIEMQPVTGDDAKAAARLLQSAGLSGRSCAIDATIATMALGARRPVLMLTSDPKDMQVLCGDMIELARV